MHARKYADDLLWAAAGWSHQGTASPKGEGVANVSELTARTTAPYGTGVALAAATAALVALAVYSAGRHLSRNTRKRIDLLAGYSREELRDLTLVLDAVAAHRSTIESNVRPLRAVQSTHRRPHQDRRRTG